MTWKNLKENLVKAFVYAVTGVVTYPGLCVFNRLRISGMGNLAGLPKKNVLFVSNHQTYFTEVICFIHIFCARRFGRKKSLGFPIYLFWPFTRIKFVAAGETMRSNLLAKFFTLAGAITVKRTWNAAAKEERRGLDASDTRKTIEALQENWVITFPQGTTTPFAPARKGTALIIRQTNPIVIPVVIDGFSTAFDKKGLKLRKRNTKLSVRFKAPLSFGPDESNEEITQRLMVAIEQDRSFTPETT